MSEDGTDQSAGEPTVAECIEAGLYYFARDDFEAARSWWERALLLDPQNSRVQECLRILSRTAPRGEQALDEVSTDKIDVPKRISSLSSPAQAIDQWSRPSLPPEESSFLSGPGFDWDPSEQLAIDGGIGLTEPREPTKPPIPEQENRAISDEQWDAALSEYMSRSPAPVQSSDPWPSVTRQAPPPPPEPRWGQSAHMAADLLDDLVVEQGPRFPSRPPRPSRPVPQAAPERPAAAPTWDPPIPAKAPLTPPPRVAVERLFGDMPENLPPADPFSDDAEGSQPLEPLEFDEAEASPRDLLDGHDSLLPPAKSDRGAGALDAVEIDIEEAEPPARSPAPDLSAFSLDAFEGEDREDITIEEPVERPGTTPWDFGPAATTAVEVERDSGEDALAEMTPQPLLDRAPLFQMANARLDDPGHGAFSMPPRDAMSDAFTLEPPPAETAIDPMSPANLLARASDRFQLHDFDGALELLEQIPPEHPAFEEGREMLETVRGHLEQIYGSKIGPFDATPRVLLNVEELIWLNLNHRAGFILSQIDGHVTYDDLVALSGMPRLDTLRILCTLLQEGVIGTD